MTLLPADFALLGLTVLLTALGLFRGFSGAFAFLAALSLGGAVAAVGWTSFLAGFNPPLWRGVIALIVFLVVFGIVRFVIKTIVRKLLAQPSDSIFGVILGLFCGALLLLGVADNPNLRTYSTLAQAAHELVFGADVAAERPADVP